MRPLPLRDLRLVVVSLALTVALPAAAGLPRDWAALDDTLERSRLLSIYMRQVVQPDDGYEVYRDRVRYAATADSLGPEAWALLPPAEQDRRRRLAEPWRDRLEASRRVIGRLHNFLADRSAAAPVGAGPPTGTAALLEGGAELVLLNMGALVNIVGLVPDDAEAWADLGWFAGCVGDTRRQEQAYETFRRLHDGMAPREQEAFLARRVRVCLDLAWLARDRGDADLAVARCLEADHWLERQPGAVDLGDREARLISALARAEQGRLQEARELAAPLGDLPFRRRSVSTHRYAASPGAPGDDETANRFQDTPGYWATTLPNAWTTFHTAQKGSWETGTSNWARQWVQVLVRLRSAAPEDALQKLGEPDLLRELPAGLNHRYWNDWGRVYEQLGHREQARLCYAMATMYRPYFVYYPVEGRRGFSQLHTRPGEPRIYFAGAGLFYAAGDRYAHAAGCLLEWEFSGDAERREELHRLAEEGFNACRNRGIRPTDALAQRGRLRYLSGDLARAETDLHQAVAEYREQGGVDPQLLLVTGLVHFNGADYEGAFPWLEEACRLQPDAAVAWSALGLAAAHAGRLAPADTALSRALRLRPDDPGGWFNRGLVRAKAGRRQEAVADLERAEALMPGNADVVRVREAIEQGPLPNIALSATPIVLGTNPDTKAAIDRLQAINLAAEMGAPSVVRALAPETDANRAELEDLHLRDPSPRNRTRLARVYLAEGRPDLVQDLLVPVWDLGLTDEELLVLLAADRELGETARARALVGGLSGTAPVSASSAVWQLAGAICLEGDLDQQAQQALEHAAGLGVTPEGESR